MPRHAPWRPTALVLFAALCVSPRARSEEVPVVPAARAMALGDALEYALAHQPQVHSALAELAARRSEARIPRAGWLPQVGATAQLIYGTANNSSALYLNVPEVDIPRIGGTPSMGTSWTPEASTFAAVSIDQEIYDFGRIAAQSAVADALTDVARAGAEATRLDVELGVEEAFHGVLAAHDVLSATDEAYRRAVAHRDFAAAGTKTGLRPPIDLTRAEAEVAQLDVQRIRTRSGLRAARAALAAALGSDALEIDAIPLSTGQEPAPAFQEALQTAAKRNPAIAAALSHLAAQTATTRALGRELLPNLFAAATLSGRAGGVTPTSGDVPTGDGWLPDIFNWSLGPVLQWNVFDATMRARRDAAQAREAVARADVDVARLNVALGTQRAWLDLVAALDVLPGLGKAVDAARANQAQAEARFKAGLGTIIDVTDADTLLIRAQLELAIGQFTVARSRATLARTMGERTSPTPTNPREP